MRLRLPPFQEGKTIFTTRWKQKILDFCIFTTEDGREIFFPFALFGGFGVWGAFRGYLLPKAVYKSIIFKSFVWFNIVVLATFAITIPIGRMFNLTLESAFFIGLIDYVLFYWKLKRITRKLPLLPRDLSVRAYASLQDPQILWKHFWSLLFIIIILGYFAFVGPFNTAIWVILGLLCVCLALHVYVLILQNRENSVSIEVEEIYSQRSQSSMFHSRSELHP